MKLKQHIALGIIAGAMMLSQPSYAWFGHDHDDHGHDHGSHEKQDDHGHDHGDHNTPNTPEFEHKDYGNVAKAWDALNKSSQDAESAVKDNNFEAIHGIYPELAASAHYLLDNSDLEDKAQKTRLKAALGQLTSAIESFHEYSHSGDDYAKEAKRELKKINGALKLVGAYYPSDLLKAE